MLLQVLKSIFAGGGSAGELDGSGDVAPDGSCFLNIGCGSRRLDGFVNIDSDAPEADLRLDMAQGLPFEDNSIDGIRCEHFVEHLSKANACIFMREARRVLKKDGVLRIAMPGQRQAAAACLSAARTEQGDESGYDRDGLVALGMQTGFRLLGWTDTGSSAVERFRRLDDRKDSMAAEFAPAYGAYAESVSMPAKVSILIPAYNPRYFEAALRSAVAQDYPNLEIIVADDSPGSDIRVITERYAARHGVIYIRNAPAEGPAFNYQKLFRVATGDYIKYLNDDDILLPDCVATMARTLAERPSVALVTSYRQLIDEEGLVQPDTINAPAMKRSGILYGQHAAHLMVKSRINYVGEPSTAMFRKRELEVFGPALFDFFGKEILGNVDMVMWLKLLSVGDLCYFVTPLSQFRHHPEQIQRDPAVIPFLVESSHILARHAERAGLHALVPTQAKVLHVEA